MVNGYRRVYTLVSIYWSCIRMTIEISYVSEVRYKRVNAFIQYVSRVATRGCRFDVTAGDDRENLAAEIIY